MVHANYRQVLNGKNNKTGGYTNVRGEKAGILAMG